MKKVGLLAGVAGALVIGLFVARSSARTPEEALREEGWTSIECVKDSGSALCNVGVGGGTWSRWRCSDPWFGDSSCIVDR